MSRVRVKREVVEGVGEVATVEVPNYVALLSYRRKDEVKTIVFPSPTCPMADFSAIIGICGASGYAYGPHVGLKSHEEAAARAAAIASAARREKGESSKQEQGESSSSDGGKGEIDDDEKDPKSGEEDEAGGSSSGGTGKEKVV